MEPCLLKRLYPRNFQTSFSIPTTVFQNNTLSSAIYMSKWYEYNVTSKRALIILMERSKRPMIVTAGKVFDLSLQTFTTVKSIRIFYECI
jgi:hypothetical protein